MNYEDFDITILREQDGYRIVVHSPGGEPKSPFRQLFSDADLTSFRKSLGHPVRDARRERPERSRLEAQAKDIVKNFGSRLFETLFADNVRASLLLSFNIAKNNGKGVRIRLNLGDVPELATLPWEYLYNRARQQYLALSVQTPIVRYLPLDEPATSLLVKPPLNILVMISDPSDYQRLQVEDEWKSLYDVLEPLRCNQQVTIDRLSRARVDELQKQLWKKQYHIFHFIGHGDFDPDSGEGTLVWEDGDGKGQLVGQETLRTVLDHDKLRLVILNSCEGARTGQKDPFAGVAQSLVQRLIPAVIAMQFKITDKAAIAFAGKFYGALTEGFPIDAALGEARKAISLDANPVEWGTPALYMRSPDGFIFKIDRPSEEEQRQARIAVLTRGAITSIEKKNYADAIKKLQDLLQLDQQQG